jgi:energy-coupling factor transporter ATP-binding protein EcfA2
MQLTAFQIFKYRNIEDSGLVKLADRLTCIVGKNQSGKTNLLKALQMLNPHDKTIKYDLRSDWPRGDGGPKMKPVRHWCRASISEPCCRVISWRCTA